MRWNRMCWMLLLVCTVASGCNLLTPLIFIGEHKKKVSPEFDKLANSRVVILVWTDQSTLFDYPHARLELATYVADKLFAELTQRDPGTELVDSAEVEDFLQQNLEAQIDPYAVGKHFDADYVVHLEVLEFQIRDPELPQLLRGSIHASVTVFDVRMDRDVALTFELTPVRCTFPEHGPVLMTATNSEEIREATYHKFSELVARKFYEYTVDL